MSKLIQRLPITERIEPRDQQELAGAVQRAYESDSAIYPIGGGTSLGFGLPARRAGIALSLANLNRLVDYPARDMTITVEAGMTMKTLADKLAAQGQRLPVDAADADRATVGGLVATGWNGPRRYGFGRLRDYVIGVSAVDGCGRPFQGGGRVVKNVAGYDFCKLLTGSLGTLGVITQLTLRLRPVAERFLLMAAEVADLDSAERRLSELVHADVTPSAIELLAGPAWAGDPALPGPLDPTRQAVLVVALEGTRAEVRWMQSRLASQWRGQGAEPAETISGGGAAALWDRLVAFPAGDAPLVIQASVVPSGTTRMIQAARAIDPACSIQAHAGNGVVIARFSELPPDGLSAAVVGQLQPVARSLHGNVVVLSNPSGAEMTRQSVWGGIGAPLALMTRIKQAFDPKNLLNPGRFVYP